MKTKEFFTKWYFWLIFILLFLKDITKYIINGKIDIAGMLGMSLGHFFSVLILFSFINFLGNSRNKD